MMKNIISIFAVVIALAELALGVNNIPGKYETKAGGTSNIGDLVAESLTTTTTNSGSGNIYGATGVLSGGVLSTTTPTSLTLKPSDVQNVTLISMVPTVGNITVTLPATTTSGMSTWIPNTGDSDEILFQNATTTAGVTVTLAAGTGTLVLNSSTTAAIRPGGIALLRAVRKAYTDISFFLSPGI